MTHAEKLLTKWRESAAEHNLLADEAESRNCLITAASAKARADELYGCADELEAALASQPRTDAEKLLNLVEQWEDASQQNASALGGLGFSLNEHASMPAARATAKEASRLYAECAGKLRAALASQGRQPQEKEHD